MYSIILQLAGKCGTGWKGHPSSSIPGVLLLHGQKQDCRRAFVQVLQGSAEGNGGSANQSKLQFFVMVASELQPLPKLYQADQPMIPFLTTDHAALVKDIMNRFVKPSVMSATKTVTAVTANQVDPSKVDVGFSASRSLQITKSSDRARYTFRLECRDFLVVMLKIPEKKPTAYPLMRNLDWLDR